MKMTIISFFFFFSLFLSLVLYMTIARAGGRGGIQGRDRLRQEDLRGARVEGGLPRVLGDASEERSVLRGILFLFRGAKLVFLQQGVGGASFHVVRTTRACMMKLYVQRAYTVQ